MVFSKHSWLFCCYRGTLSNTLLMTWVVHCLQFLYQHRSNSNIRQELLMAQIENLQSSSIKQGRFACFFLCPGVANIVIFVLKWEFSCKVQMVPIGQLSMKKLALVGHGGKLWRWKRSHHQWLLQFKWKWQKPWKLSEFIRHSDETIMKSRPRQQALPDVMYRNGH